MSAATADHDTRFFPDGLKEADYPVKAATKIYAGTAVAIDATGYAVPLTNSALVTFVGIAENGVDNSAGLDGAVDVRVRRLGVIKMISSGLAITDAGCNLYWVDDQTVQKAATNQYAGKLARYTAADEAEIDFTDAVRQSPSAAAMNAYLYALMYTTVPVAAATAITAGNLVAVNSTGYAVVANNAAAGKFVGVALATVDNSGGSDGDLNVIVQQRGRVTLAGTGFTQADVERPVFVLAAATVQITPTDNNLLVGRIAAYIGATSVSVELAVGLAGKGMDVVSLPVHANKNINVLGAMVGLSALGGALLMNDASALSFMGICLATVDNTGGALGDKRVWVARTGSFNLTIAGSSETDAGKECWQTTDAVTVTITPGDNLVGIIERYIDATHALVRIRPLAIRGERTERQHWIHFSHSGATLNGKLAFADREFPCKYLPLAMFADVEIAPGGTDTLTCRLADGVTDYDAVITGSATHGENKTPGTTPYLAGTDTDLELIDTATTSANVKGAVLVEDC